MSVDPEDVRIEVEKQSKNKIKMSVFAQLKSGEDLWCLCDDRRAKKDEMPYHLRRMDGGRVPNKALFIPQITFERDDDLVTIVEELLLEFHLTAKDYVVMCNEVDAKLSLLGEGH